MNFFDDLNFDANAGDNNAGNSADINADIQEETPTEKQSIPVETTENATQSYEASQKSDVTDAQDVLNTSEVSYTSDQTENTSNNLEENVTDSETPENVKIVSGFAGNDIFPEDFFWNDVLIKQNKKRKKANTVSVIIMATALLIGALIVVGSYLGRGWISNMFNGKSNIEFTLPLVDKPKLEDQYYQNDGRYTPAGVAKALEKSIVSIIAYTVSNDTMGQAMGSGIIMSKDGYIITNAHVIEDYVGEGVKVVLNDKTTYQATIVGSDMKTDIAVLKIVADDLTPVEFGNSDEVILGEEVIALGSPGGLSGSISKGIVSGLNREIKVAENQIKMNCIQVDAAINPGNSGGALVNMWGQVIGIVSSKLSSSTYDGIGFAISISAAKPIIEDLMEYGCIPGRVKIGITFLEVDEENAEIYSLPEGLYIQGIDPSCDIADTSLQVNDTITHMDGKKVLNKEDVSEIVNDKKAGDTVKATVIRGDETFEIEFKLMDDSSTLKVDK